MKKLILIVIGLALLIGAVYAPEESLGSGYAVTSNYHGIDVPIPSPVAVTAMTTDGDVYQVTFLWKKPDGSLWLSEEVSPLYEDGEYEGKPIYKADSTQTPDEIGDWGVQALFQSPDGKTKQGIEEVIKIKATSFFAIPEAAVIGTLGTVVAMLLGFGLFTTRRKNKTSQ